MLVVTADELVPAHFATLGSLSATVSRDEKRGFGMRRLTRGGNGSELTLLFDSLPSRIRMQMVDPRVGNHMMEKHYRVDVAAVEFFQKNSYTDDETAGRYVVNASVMWACLWLKNEAVNTRLRLGKRVKDSEVMQYVASELVTFGAVLERKHGVMHSLPTEYRNLRERMRRFESDGYASLVHGLAGRKSNNRKMDEYAETIIRAMYAGTGRKPNYTELVGQWNGFVDGYVEVVNKATGEMYSPDGCKKLSRTAIYDFLKSWDERIAVKTARGGDRQKLMGEFKTPHSLDIPRWAGSIVSVDDRQPPFEYAQGKRMWFYIGLDAASCAITTWVWGKDKEGIILEFYRQMVRNHARWGLCLPAELECESNLNASFTSTFLKEGVMFDYVRVEANNARGKFVESRLNRRIRYNPALEKGDTGWIARPFARDEANQAGPEKLQRVPYDTLVERCLANIETWNNMPHDTEKNMSRWDYFTRNQNPDLKPINWRALLPHLGHKTRSSVRAGQLKLQGCEMLLGKGDGISTGDELLGYLTEVDGNEVDVYWLDDDDGEVMQALVYVGDRYICNAVPKPRYNRARAEQTEADVAARELMSAYVATIEGYKTRKLKTIEKVEVIDNRKVTVNDNFRIGGRRPVVEQVDVEVMPEVTVDEVIDYETETFVKSLRDRY
jgi:hypothetical protein